MSLLSGKVSSILSRIPSPSSFNRKISLRMLLGTVLTLALLMVAGFAVGIYGFRLDNSVTRNIAKAVPYPAALVGGSPISLHDYYFTREYTEHFYQSSKLPYENGKLANQVLDQLIDQTLLVKHAGQEKISVSQDEIDQAYQKLLEKNGKDEVTKVLQDLYGLSEKEFKGLIYYQVLKQKTENHLKEKGAWKQVQVRHLLIKVDQNADEKTVSDAKAKAEDHLKKIREGKSFDEIAKAHSEDVESKDQGGELGFISRDQTVKEFEQAVFDGNAKKGDLLGPIRTNYGWHIIQIEDLRGSNDYQTWREEAKIYRFIST